ncbi:MAG: hypothetical protein GWM90_16310 [Gemmatimonadetes bacterium]|nr:hypothetical protein [Gemmatimonadota bacterium]NIQ55832.1 hypothetical protein [Gemmatimonadota bacterium]NIU76034.1 hypothetical protein [Gammaproteobacteria bacterium]NIX45606.1 hypothetical protein [Gemmatimonadota bacterium]NIY09897.1 hypothetical protein [Gemmatimonadota bacterium]
MRTYEANDETWDVYLSEERPHEGVRPLVFHCTTNTSHGWRVVEVPEDEYGAGRIAELSDEELDALFERSQPFDYPHDRKAREGSIGDTPIR